MLYLDVKYEIINKNIYEKKLPLEHIKPNGDIIKFTEFGNYKGRIEVVYKDESKVDEDVLIDFIRFIKSIMETDFGIKIIFEKDKNGK